MTENNNVQVANKILILTRITCEAYQAVLDIEKRLETVLQPDTRTSSAEAEEPELVPLAVKLENNIRMVVNIRSTCNRILKDMEL